MDTNSNSNTNTTPNLDQLCASIIQERNSLQQEADSLRGAVIFLGIFSVLALIAAVIFIVWVIITKRKSRKMESNAVLFSPTEINKQKVERTYSQMTNSPKETRTSTSREIDLPALAHEIHGSTSNLNENSLKEQLTNTTTIEDVVDTDIDSSESKYITFDSKPNPTRAIGSDDNNVYIHYDNNSDKDIYEIVINDKSPSLARKDQITTPTANIVAPQMDAITDQPEDSKEVAQEVYANCNDDAEAADVYSGLELERQNSHVYS